jgi:hypothetical protein
MIKQSLPIKRSQGKQKLGDQVRTIADRLKQETEVQIKATARILGAAAQISENHDRLIDEVVDMVEEDLNLKQSVFPKHIYTVDILKQQYKTLRDAKAHFNLKASSWETLVNKLNAVSPQKSVGDNKPYSNQESKDEHIRKIEDAHKNITRLTVFLEPDVAEMFPNSEAVNEVLRFFIRVTSKGLLENEI